MPPRIRKDLAEYLMPTIVSGVQSGMYTRDRRTDYGISVAHDILLKASNTTNLKKAFRHAGRLFETARLRQTKSS